MHTLNDRHRADLRSSGLTHETIEISGIFSASASETSEILGFNPGGGFVIPYPGTGGDEGVLYRRVKPDIPMKNGDGRPAKYLCARGAGNRLYIPPNQPPETLADPSIRLIVTEGEKKALAGNQEGFPTIALAGVACWVSKNGDGKSHPIADLERVNWEGREVFIVFDSDAATKPTVRREADKLGKELEQRGAKVRIARLPKPRPQEDRDHNLAGKFGMDDFLRVRGRGAFEDVLWNARPVRSTATEKGNVPTADLAEQFLERSGLRKNDVLHLRWWREEFYRFNGTHYERLAEGDLRARINEWLQGEPTHRGAAGTRVAMAIIQNIQAMGLVDAKAEPPFWMAEIEDQRECIALSNGVIAVDELLAGRLESLRPHSPDYFTLSSLPFPLVNDADCSRWLSFLDEVLPDRDVQTLVAEMFGYLLVNDTIQETFFLLEGAGANGKTVICTVLREILGASNVSGVSLEAFSAARTFPLAATIGKKANIVEELEEVTKAAEGVLKNFVTGKPVTIERKNRDAFDFIPTARLVFATNVLPRFIDRTDGIWRRMKHVPFRTQILDPAKQDRRLIDPNWWRSSGELPAIFLWAIGGLSELRRRGHFIEPEACRAEKESYRQDSNPAGTFLADHCEVGDGFSASSKTLYGAYHQWAWDNGFRPLSVTQFAKEVKRIHPQVELSKNARHVEGGRSHVWTGLRYLGDTT